MTDAPKPENTDDEIPTSMKINMVARLILFPPIMTLFLHLPAQDWGWVDAWLYIGFFALCATAGGFWLLKSNPDLFRERMKGSFQEEQRRKDSIVVSFLSLVMLAIYPVAALDYRFDWLMFQGIAPRLFGWALMILSMYVLYRVMRENTFLSRSIVVQDEREQQVIDTGLYGLIRHPMYFGVVLLLVGSSFVLGSVISLIPVVASIVLLYVRAAFEEELLESELGGYKNYRKKVTKRLIPFII
ncbi:MAG: methyltransferase family protein [Candidatus Kariarchaeaceae archaeon]|jgi:protein-S-isoprenylcysteine O-methyltransferase Ste14